MRAVIESTRTMVISLTLFQKFQVELICGLSQRATTKKFNVKLIVGRQKLRL